MILKTKNNQGFTILELLIATTVFSVILLVVTTGIIRIGNIYYKGITSSKTQESIRNISSEFSSSIQFANGIKVPGSLPRIFCLGNTRYTYFLNSEYTKGNEATTGIYSEILSPGSACATCSGGCVTEAKQLLGNNMRVLSLRVDPVAGTANKVWNVYTKVAYGYDDLLSNYNATPAQNSSPAFLQGVTCRSGIAGSSFCSTAELDTLVKKRLE